MRDKDLLPKLREARNRLESIASDLNRLIIKLDKEKD